MYGVLEPPVFDGGGPFLGDVFGAPVHLAVLVEIRVDEVQIELGGVGRGRDVVARVGEVLRRVRDRAKIARLPAREQAQLVELLESRR